VVATASDHWQSYCSGPAVARTFHGWLFFTANFVRCMVYRQFNYRFRGRARFVASFTRTAISSKASSARKSCTQTGSAGFGLVHKSGVRAWPPVDWQLQECMCKYILMDCFTEKNDATTRQKSVKIYCTVFNNAVWHQWTSIMLRRFCVASLLAFSRCNQLLGQYSTMDKLNSGM
jgi:hypothetical protein